MSVTITITDPASTPPEELQAVVALLSRLSGTEANTVAHVPTGDPLAVKEAASEEPGPFATAFREIFAEIGIPADELAAPVVPPPPVIDAAAAAFGTPPPPPAAPAVATLLVGDAPVGEVSNVQFTPSVELDKDGIPWDGRIHASTKTKTVEGVWKKKRGVEQSVVDAVTAELRAVMGAPAPAPAAIVPPPPPTSEATVPPPPSAVPPPPPAVTGITFAEFMGHVTAGVTSQRFTRENVAEACVKHGIPNLPGLINRPDLIPAVARELGLVA